MEAGDLFIAGETCPLCNMFRIAFTLNAFYERRYPTDYSKSTLADISASIRLR